MFWRGLRDRLKPRLINGLGLVSLCAVVGLLGFLFVQSTTGQLLEAEARIDASRWSQYISANIREVRNIAGGATATRDRRAVLDRMLGGYVMSYRIYDSSGVLKLQSAGDPLPMQDSHTIGSVDPHFALAFSKRTATTMLSKGARPGEPEFIASALMPILSDGQIIGWLVITLDQTERAHLFYTITSQASLAVCLLLIAAPVFGFWYRSRARARMEQTISKLSRHDQLTGLKLKSELLAEIEACRARSEPGSPASALLYSELSGTSAVARTHGQQAEEALINAAAERLRKLVPEGASVAAAGRGAFLVFIADVADPMAALSLARDITAKLGAAVEWDGATVASPCHSGIALSSDGASTPAELLRQAELAMLSAREQDNPGYGFYNPDLAKDTRRRIAVGRAVAAAIEHNRFRLDFQPVYSIRSGELNGFEALIRLHDPDLGFVSPAEFIPVAEEAGHINQIGAWALDEACRVASDWPQHLMVAVNLSPSQFLSGTLITDVRRALEKHRLPGYRLEVEITEGTLMNDSELVLGQLRVLRDMGIAVALDDFGTGYSSLSYLWKFPFSKLKIDRSFVNALDASVSAKGILRSIVKLGHGLGLTVTAEGIETPKQLSTLRELGCDLAQGYLLDRPARVPDLAAIIMRNFANALARRSRISTAAKAQTRVAAN